jgi:hypothetical protein
MDFLIKAAVDEFKQFEKLNSVMEDMNRVDKVKQQRVALRDMKDDIEQQAKFEAMRLLFIPHRVSITWVPVAVRACIDQPQTTKSPSLAIEEQPSLVVEEQLRPSSSTDEEKKKPKRVHRIPKGKRDRAMMPIDEPKCINALLMRLQAIVFSFTKFVPTLLSMSDNPSQWAGIENCTKVRLFAYSIVVDTEDERICYVRVEYNSIYDRMIHFHTNYDVARERYKFNQKTLFRWWSSVDTPLLSPITNISDNSSNRVVRIFTFPTKLIFHPHMVALREREDEWFATMAQYASFLIEVLVPNPDHRAVLERGGLGRCRAKLTPNLTTGELECKIIQATDTFIATLNN